MLTITKEAATVISEIVASRPAQARFAAAGEDLRSSPTAPECRGPRTRGPAGLDRATLTGRRRLVKRTSGLRVRAG